MGQIVANSGPRLGNLLGDGHVVQDSGGELAQDHQVIGKRFAAGWRREHVLPVVLGLMDAVAASRLAAELEQVGVLLDGGLLHVDAQRACKRTKEADHGNGEDNPLDVRWKEAAGVHGGRSGTARGRATRRRKRAYCD